MKRKSTEVRREQIKKAVLEIISKEGLKNLSTRNLAKKVGITEGAIFRHFKTKRDIILGIMKDVKSTLMVELRQVALSEENSDTKLFKFLCTHVKYLIKNKGITILLFSEVAHMNDKELKGNLYNILSEQKILVEKIVKEGIENGIWTKKVIPQDFAMIYMGIPISLNIELILNSDRIGVENFCKRMFKLILEILK
ncbi:MAG: TetR/AcrR family transcriptional regulator [Ignavibacteria bacterium]